MRRVFVLFFSLLIFISNVQAFEMVLPKEKKSVVNTKYALFVGKAGRSETISINDKSIYVAPNGAFAHSVKLKDGNNRIVVKSDYSKKFYTLYKTPEKKCIQSEIKTYETLTGFVNKDNAPMRNTPIDAGMNCIAHLFQGTEVLITGEKDNFYQIYLSKNKTAWIAKDDVTIDYDAKPSAAEFIGSENKKYKNAIVKSIAFTKKLPYEIEENDKEIVFKVYNPEQSNNSVYSIEIPKSEKFSYSVTLEDGKYTIKLTDTPQSIENCTIAIDAGHGGSEKGAVGCLSDCEKDINLKIAHELQKQLTEAGATVIMTRECDANVSLNERVDFAKENNANIFVSIHLNSIGDVCMNLNKNKGTSIYYYNPNSRKLANILEDSVTKAAGTRKDGVKTASFAVIRPTNYIGVLVECAYMINPHDTMLYRSDKFAKNVAKGICDGILKFIKNS